MGGLNSSCVFNSFLSFHFVSSQLLHLFFFISSHWLFFHSFFLMGCYSLFWVFLALIFRLDYFRFFWVSSRFVMFVLSIGFMTWDQSFKYQHQTLKLRYFWLHFLGLFYEIKASSFFLSFFSLCILLLSSSCSRWVLFKEMKMWSGEDAFCLALIFVGSTTLLEIPLRISNQTHYQ